MKVFPDIMVLFACSVVSACAATAAQAPESEPDSLQQARALWDKVASSRYQFSFRQKCFCPQAHRQMVRVTVDSGEVTEVQPQDGEGPVPDDLAGAVKTIPQWFAFIEGRGESESARLKVRYNPDAGYPEKIFLDRHVRMADDEMTWYLGDLQFNP